MVAAGTATGRFGLLAEPGKGSTLAAECRSPFRKGRAEADRALRNRAEAAGAATSYADNPELLVMVRWALGAVPRRNCRRPVGRPQCCWRPASLPATARSAAHRMVCHFGAARSAGVRAPLTESALRHPGRCFLILVDEAHAAVADVAGGGAVPNSAGFQPASFRPRKLEAGNRVAFVGGGAGSRTLCESAFAAISGCGADQRLRPSTIWAASWRDSGRRGHRRRIHCGLLPRRRARYRSFFGARSHAAVPSRVRFPCVVDAGSYPVSATRAYRRSTVPPGNVVELASGRSALPGDLRRAQPSRVS